MHRVIATGVRGIGSPASCASSWIRAGMLMVDRVPGASSRRSSMSTTVRSGGASSAPANRTGRVASRIRRSAQVRTDSDSTQRPITFLRNRIVPSIPASLVKPASRASSVSTGISSSRPTSDQVPEEM